MSLNLAIEIGGWIGSVGILLAYGLNSYQKLRSDSITFYLLNLISGILLIVYSFHKDAIPNAFINIVWVVIALIAIIRYATRKEATK